MLDDTAPQAHAVQVRLLRKAGPDRRLELAIQMTEFVREMSRQGIRRRHPEWPELEVKLKLGELCYGRELMDKVRAYLAERDA